MLPDPFLKEKQHQVLPHIHITFVIKNTFSAYSLLFFKKRRRIVHLACVNIRIVKFLISRNIGMTLIYIIVIEFFNFVKIFKIWLELLFARICARLYTYMCNQIRVQPTRTQ